MTTLGNSQLECEYLTSWFLKENLIPEDYVKIRLLLADTPDVSISDDFDILISELKKYLFDNFGLLKDSVIEKYAKGKDNKLFNLIQQIQVRVSTILPLIYQGIKEQEVALVQKLEQDFQGQDFVGMGEVIRSGQEEQKWLDSTHTQMIDLYKIKSNLKSVLELYGAVQTKPLKKDVTFKNNVDYKLYLLDLHSHLDDYISDAHLAMVVGQALDAISSVQPTNELDPYQLDVCNNVIQVLSNPTNFYRECTSESILNSNVGLLFSHCYPEFHNKFLYLYLDDVNNMSNQEVINFRNCFGLPIDNSELVSLCSKYVTLTYA